MAITETMAMATTAKATEISKKPLTGKNILSFSSYIK